MVKKRKQAPIQNPLSNARLQKQSNKNDEIKNTNNSPKGNSGGKRGKKKQNVQLSKAEIKAQGLWHRKTNAGYSLFISYYGEQPIGVCVGPEDVLDQSANNDRKEDYSEGNRGLQEHGNVVNALERQKCGAGQSRAAKRRRKKKTHCKGSQPKDSIHINTENVLLNHNNTEHTKAGLFFALQNSKLTSSSSLLLQTFHKHPDVEKYMHILPYLIALSKPLPLTFRFRYPFSNASSKGNDKTLISDTFDFEEGQYDKLDKEAHQQQISNMEEFYSILEKDNLISTHMKPVSYDPNKCIYQAQSSDSSKFTLKYNAIAKVNLSEKSPRLKSLLMKYSANGSIARQEIGSMLPVLALMGLNCLEPKVSSTPHSHTRILDMCASPGSKTLQALEQVAFMKGRVVANDIHPQRLQSLKEAIGRSGLSSLYLSRVKYTNYDASRFPLPKSKRLFDVVMADVPCSGDGTIRKEVDDSSKSMNKNMILSSWTPNIGNALHDLQVKILVRALELICVNGVVCYSTCSLNPVEDEAVVAAALKVMSNSGKKKDEQPLFELLDFPIEKLPGFIRRKGVHQWKVADYRDTPGHQDNYQDADSELNLNSIRNDEKGKTHSNDDVNHDDDFGSLRWHNSFKEAMDNGMINSVSTLWPPNLSKGDSNTSVLPALERCTRLFPQDQDTGGFFVALIRRIS